MVGEVRRANAFPSHLSLTWGDYGPTALKVPHPHAVPRVGKNKKSPLKRGGFVILWRWAKK